MHQRLVGRKISVQTTFRWPLANVAKTEREVLLNCRGFFIRKQRQERLCIDGNQQQREAARIPYHGGPGKKEPACQQKEYRPGSMRLASQVVE